jgi:hypothetical protein
MQDGQNVVFRQAVQDAFGPYRESIPMIFAGKGLDD